jgi:hypothetical protein
MIRKKLVEYLDFWLIWLSCVSQEKSLFQIQQEWGIRTNYLYHKESALGKPLFSSMIDQNYLIKVGRKLKGTLDWVQNYIPEKHPDTLIEKHKETIQEFVEKHHQILFNLDNLKILFKNDINLIKKNGDNIFSYITLYILYLDLSKLCAEYGADIVMEMFTIIFSVLPEVDFLGYMKSIDEDIGKIETEPLIIKDVKDLISL